MGNSRFELSKNEAAYGCPKRGRSKRNTPFPNFTLGSQHPLLRPEQPGQKVSQSGKGFKIELAHATETAAGRSGLESLLRLSLTLLGHPRSALHQQFATLAQSTMRSLPTETTRLLSPTEYSICFRYRQ